MNPSIGETGSKKAETVCAKFKTGEGRTGTVTTRKKQNAQCVRKDQNSSVQSDSSQSNIETPDPVLEAVQPFWYVYILCCRDGTFYTGSTNRLPRRLKAHNQKKGARYTRSRLPVLLVYHEVFLSRHDALSREWHLKQLSRKEKLDLILSQNAVLVDADRTGRLGKPEERL
nr:GIY-YIG nuclease family protein [Allobaculum fili]